MADVRTVPARLSRPPPNQAGQRTIHAVAGRDLVIDESAPLDFLAEGSRGNLEPRDRTWMAPLWVDEINRRRLERYKFLDALIYTVGRYYQPSGTEAERSARREYGDAALLVEAAVNALIGEDVDIVVDGADEEPNGAPAKRQDDLRQWAEDEGFIEKLFEAEWDAVGLGDTVYTLGWSNSKDRVRLRTYNPGFYFPVLGDRQDDDYPATVHFGWEFEERQADGTLVVKVRRITFDLTVPGLNGNCALSEGVWTFDSLEQRSQDDFDESRAVWETNEDGEVLHNLDLGIDFVPVVHIPNTPASQTHFGKSLLLFVVQLLWDIASNDTDADKAAATTGTPMVSLERFTAPQSAPSAYGGADTAGSNGGRVEPPKLEVRPGAILPGKASVLDVSEGVTILQGRGDWLRHLLSVNSQMPAETLGRLTSQTDMSGIRFALAFGPLRRLVRKMRLVRERKYPLLFKFVQRITIAHGAFPGGGKDVAKVSLAFGAFLPTDRKAVIDEVIALVEAGLLTPRTGLQILVDEGIVDVDVAEEIAALEAADTAKAKSLLNTFRPAVGNGTGDDPGADPRPSGASSPPTPPPSA